MAMRNYSKQTKSTYYKFQSLPRNFTQQKRLQQLHTLKDTEVKVGIYKYSTDDELGKGYSSKVYKGVQIQKIHKRYAIKVIELKKFRGSNLEMLEAEIQIHRNLVHDNILRLYQVIKTPYFYYLILEYCPHGNLHQYIRQKKKLTETNAVDIMDQVLSGYRYLIEQGVIHRDMKPANILRVGNKWKISDFGFAVKSKYGFKDRINVGTPLYMSPQSLKKSYYSSKTDIFSLGVVLYEMLEGRTPWQSSNQKQLLQKMKQEVAIPQSVKNNKIRQFIMRCCMLNQNKRMSREELLQFQLTSPSIVPPEVVSASNIPISEKESLVVSDLGGSNTKGRKPSLYSDMSSSKPVQDPYKHNHQVLVNQFLLTKHIYSCIKNIDSFLLQTESKQIFALTLFKYLLRLIRFLCDKKVNTFNLKDWQDYTGSKVYNQLYQDMVFHSEVFQKQYLEQIKHNDIKIIRTVNRKFPDLCHNAPISQKFYQALKEHMVPLIREHNHEVMTIYIAKEEGSKQDNKEKQKLQTQQGGKAETMAKKQEEQPVLVEYKISSVKKEQILAESPAKQVSQIKTEQPKTDKEKTQSKLSSRLQIKNQSKRQSKLSIKSQRQKYDVPQPKLQQAQTHKSTTINDKIQALQSLYTIYRLADLRQHADGKQIAMQKMKVLMNYSESKLQKIDYLDLRRLMRSL